MSCIHESTIIQKTPYDWYNQCFDISGEPKIEISPSYQRDIVWENEHYIKFLESLFCGIVPNPIIINVDTKTNKKVIIDGKQRTTSIKLFFDNKIPYCIIENNKAILFRYNKINKDKHIEKYIKEINDITEIQHKILDDEKKSYIENEIQLTIVQYKNLTYENQVDIFNRLQYGISISRGSYLKSLISNEEICKYIIEMAERYQKYFGKYARDKNKDEHIEYLLNILFMIDSNTTQIKKITVQKNLKKLTLKIIKDFDKKYEKLIKTLFDKKILNKYSFPQKIILNVLLFSKNEDIDKNKMENVVDTLNDIKNFGNNEEIQTLITKIYNDEYSESDSSDNDV